MVDKSSERSDRNEIIARLSRVLLHETRLGCIDRAVFGGLEKFVAAWAGEAGPVLRSTALSSFPQEAVEALRDYARKGPAERETHVRSLLGQLSPAATRALPTAPNSTRRHGDAERSNVGADGPVRPGVERGTAGLQRTKGISSRAGEARGAGVTRRTDRPRPPAPARIENRDVKGPAGQPAPPKRRASTRPAPPASGRSAGTSGTRLQGLDSSVRTQPGVGNAYAAKLERIGCFTIRDLLYLIPRRHVDYSVMRPISDLRVGQVESVLGTIWEIRVSPSRSGVKLTTATVADETGTINGIWFNQPHLTKTLTAGKQVVLSGRVEESFGRPFFKAPDWELPQAGDLIHTGRMIPVYPLTEGLPERWLRALVKRVLDRWIGELQDHLPLAVRKEWNLLDLTTAISQIHFPDRDEDLQNSQRRLAFDELLVIQLGMLSKKREWQESQPGNPFNVNHEVLNTYLSALPFAFTSAQKKVTEEILADLRSRTPMARLLQGEVGSGKTVVAAAAMVVARDNGFQSALMAPTEILAEQHYRTVTNLMRPMEGLGRMGSNGIASGIGVGLLTGNTKKADKEALREAVGRGEIDILIGTHAVIQEEVRFARLGLVVVDEQHRFGVEQRTALQQKGYNPHLLAMSATPIPRTLALTLYGDLDLSIIDELPPGRQQVTTYLIGPEKRQRAYDFVRKQIAEGRQAFIICPLVEESEKIEAKAAIGEYERLKAKVFQDLKLGLLHGKMRSKEKEAVMADFRDGRLDILVSTAVVEVGIDVPNATVMLIEGADRFGLAQIHQFRGRVGRGANKSYCLLVAESPSAEAEERLQAITRIYDGFLLAEEDLRLRGPGEFFGTRQSGLPDLKVARLSDAAILEQARAAATEILNADRRLELPEHRLLAQKVMDFWRAEGHLS